MTPNGNGSLGGCRFTTAAIRGSLLTVAAAAATATSPAAWASAPQYTIQQVGFAGDAYTYFGAAASYSSVTQVSASGQMIGYTTLYAPDGENIGRDGWVFSGGSTVRVGLTGSDHQFTFNGGTGRRTSPNAINAAGQVVGSSERYNATGQASGSDAWVWNGTSTALSGLTGSGYEYNAGGVSTHANFATQLNDAGQIAGSTYRFNSAGTRYGYDTWVMTGTSTVLVGLTGGAYEYANAGGTYRQSSLGFLNVVGQAAGFTLRWDPSGSSLGQDAWLSKGNTTTLVGLTGSGYEYVTIGGTGRNGSVQALNNAGQAAGYSIRYSSAGDASGQDAWLTDGAVTRRIGLSGDGYEFTRSGATIRQGYVQQLNASGQVAGYTARYDADGSNLGQDAWVFNGVSTTPIGLTGSGYEVAFANGTRRSSAPQYLNAAGQAAGYTYLYAGNGRQIGQDGWVSTGTSTRRAGLVGSGYEYVDYENTLGGRTVRNGFVRGLNAAGQAIGLNYRYDAAGNSLGQAGWFFDDDTGASTALLFSVNSAGYGLTTPQYLTEAGIVLGSYVLYSGDAYLGSRLFEWTTADGFVDLGNNVAGGLTAAGWKSLASVVTANGATAGGSAANIAGYGLLTGQTNGQSVFLLTAAVPEPAAVGAVTMGAIAWFGRRRRRA